MSVLLVTHDLGVVAQTCDRVAVMYAGRIVERADTRELFAGPRIPTPGRCSAALPARTARGRAAARHRRRAARLAAPPPGCRFHPRCAYAEAACIAHDPPLRGYRRAGPSRGLPRATQVLP